MVKVAIVGYREFPSVGSGDFIVWLPRRISSFYPDISFCHEDIIEDRNGKSVDESVAEMIASNPDVLHYANFRDSYTRSGADRQYIGLVQRLSKIPILLTTGHNDRERIAGELGVRLLDVPFRLDDYPRTVRELATKP